ncbi:hypothetical protein [Candidatus Solincola tengchongensis]|uniref:hypothetical protein n=1 Tax=Candidatus Solincola tengchongensis TaxID=2900693 RepID=UPI00257E923B|nr:hypothetical protein [Candidatus Solincola tengchongensis]
MCEVKEVPDYERYPVSEEEMGKRYRNWTEVLARQVVTLYRVGREVGGEEFVQRLREEFYRQGKKGASMWMALSGTRPEDFADCTGLPRLQDTIDDAFANFWDGYVESTPHAFEKELKTCPVARIWSREPDICEIMIAASLVGMLEELNPRFRTTGFTKLLTKGDPVCRFRVELAE